MLQHNFIIGPTDTDSISFCKNNMAPFSKEEVEVLLNELRSISPEFMEWEDDGYYPKCLVIRAKNYILEDIDGKRKIKGSALKDQKQPQKIQQFKHDIINAIMNEEPSNALIEIYHQYVASTKDIQDILPWSKKLTITNKIVKCEGHDQLSFEEKKEKKIRKNETDVYDAVKDIVVQEGDKIWVYFNNNDGLTLTENFNGKYDRNSLLRNLFTSVKIFQYVIDITPFKNFTLKKNLESLKQLDEVGKP